MTQEWFESADLEKKSPQTKSEIQPDQPETSETVETEPQASEETPISPKESEKHEEEAPETIEEAQTEEEGEGKAEEEHKQENPTKEKSILSKALESPYIPDIDPRKTARFKEDFGLGYWMLSKNQLPARLRTKSTVTVSLPCSLCYPQLTFSLVSIISNTSTTAIWRLLPIVLLTSSLL